MNIHICIKRHNALELMLYKYVIIQVRSTLNARVVSCVSVCVCVRYCGERRKIICFVTEEKKAHGGHIEYIYI